MILLAFIISALHKWTSGQSRVNVFVIFPFIRVTQAKIRIDTNALKNGCEKITSEAKKLTAKNYYKFI